MKENDVEFIATQFGIQKDIVEASVNDGTLSARLKDSLAGKKIYTADEFETFKKNHAIEVTTSYYNELVEKAKKGDVPQDLYKPIKGASYQQLERDLAKEHDISEYKDIKDLLGKVVSKSASNKDPDLTKKIEDLKTANIKLQEEKENAVKGIEEKYKLKAIDREKLDTLTKVPFDFSDAKAEDLEKVTQKTRTLLKSVFDAEYKMDFDDKGNPVVIDREGNVKKNGATLEPVSAYEVMVDLAKEYNLKLQSSDKGGQGGKSSQGDSALFGDAEAYTKYCESKGLNPYSKEALELFRKSGLNKTK